MKIGSLAPWFGGKRVLAPEVCRQLGKHRAYWEPFCGSCAVLFAKERAMYETVNDLHTDLINLALVVADFPMAEGLYFRAAATFADEELLSISKKHLKKPWVFNDEKPDPERAYWYLVYSWMGINGIAGTPLGDNGTFAVRWTAKGGNGARRWLSAVQSIPDWHERLQGVQILRRDGFQLLENIADEEGTAIYCDPPYLEKGAKYVHDFTPAGHARLSNLLHGFRKARVVVSYYDHPELLKLYPSWSKLDCSVPKHLVQSAKRNKLCKKPAPEVLLVNGPLAQGELF